MPMRRLCVPIAAVLVACGPKPATSPKTQPPSSAAVDAAPARPPTIDGARLFSIVEHLASDALGGRYTLSPDIRTSADYLAAQLKASGVAPVGTSYAHEFALVTGAEPTTPPTLAIATGTKRAEIDPTAFVPLSGSASGSIDGEVVFVG